MDFRHYELTPRAVARSQPWRLTTAVALVLSLAGCAGLGASGPSTKAVTRADGAPVANSQIRVIELTDAVARSVTASTGASRFSDRFGLSRPVGSQLGPGDVVDVSIWEAPPALLFGPSVSDGRTSVAPTTSRGTTLPEQVIDGNGRLSIPFVGPVAVAGRTPKEVERLISQQLQGKANLPQVIVRLVRNATANVTVVGEVTNSTRVALTPKGERLLDVLAVAGGVRQPVGKTTIQITRRNQVVSMPLEAVIRDPLQNVILAADDVVTAYYQPFSFTALGAIGNNAEIPFEATGLTLAQALGRIGGLRDERADVRGVFIFRLEDPAALGETLEPGTQTTPDGKVPVIYRVDLKNPASFFVTQGFPVRNQDVVYVSNAPIADLQKFVNIISQMTFSIIGVAKAL